MGGISVIGYIDIHNILPCTAACTAIFNPLMLTNTFDEIFRGKSKVQKIFEGELFMRTLKITLLQIFSKIILNFRLIAKGIIGPDDNFWRNS